MTTTTADEKVTWEEATVLSAALLAVVAIDSAFSGLLIGISLRL